MTPILDALEPTVAAGLLARAALALESSSQNPATAPLVPDELYIRERVIAEVRARLGITPGDVSNQAIALICEELDEESDQLAVKPDLEGAALRLSWRGELPSDRFKVDVVPNLQEVYEPYFEAEVLRIKETIHSPDFEQHFGPPLRQGEPALISLFLRYYPNPYPYRSFYYLVAGQRAALTLTVHQAWRLYPSVMQMVPSSNLVGLLRNFAEVYGTEVSAGGVTGKMIVNASLPAGIKSISIQIPNVKLGAQRPGAKESRAITSWFLQKNDETGELRGSLIVSINLTEYRKLLKRMHWEDDGPPTKRAIFQYESELYGNPKESR